MMFYSKPMLSVGRELKLCRWLPSVKGKDSGNFNQVDKFLGDRHKIATDFLLFLDSYPRSKGCFLHKVKMPLVQH